MELLKCKNKFRDQSGNSLVENVIIMPLIIIIVFFFIMFAFVLHDKSTLDAAAKRGSLYAAKCISDPGYIVVLNNSGNESGSLDSNVAGFTEDSFKGVGNGIDPFRYFIMKTQSISDATTSEVQNIIKKTKIPWREIQADDIKVSVTNMIIYQKVTVSIAARYPLPKFFGAFGLPTEYEYEVSSSTTVNDPDEFIRNTDLVIDIIAEIDNATGGNISKAVSKIEDLASKIKDFKITN